MNKVFVYLRLRLGETLLSRSKIREFGALGTLLPEFLRQTVENGVVLPEELETGARPVLDYVDGNTERVLISFRLDPKARTQVVEGCIPPAYQPRMLDPEATSFSFSQFMAGAIPEHLPAERRAELAEHMALRAKINLLDRIRETIDGDGNFLLHLPL